MTQPAATGMVDNEASHDICHRNVDVRDGVHDFADPTQDVFATTCTET